MSSDLAIRIRAKLRLPDRGSAVLRRLSSLPRRSSEGLLVGGARPEQRRGFHAGAGGHGADRARSRRRARSFGRRADDDGRLFRELSSERRAGGTPLVARPRRMDVSASGRCPAACPASSSASSSASRSAPSPAWSTASSSSMAGSSRSSPRWRRARSSSASRSSCGRSPAARSTTT